MVEFVIKDGSSGKTAKVNEGNQLEVFSIQETQLTHVSTEHGQAFAWYSSYQSSANEEVLSLQNDSSDLLLHLDQLWIGGDAVGQWAVGFQTSTTAAGGTTITGLPLNKDRSQTAEATAFGNAAVTGSITFDKMAQFGVVADDSKQIDLEGSWILGKNDVFIVSDILGQAANGFVTVIGHYGV